MKPAGILWAQRGNLATWNQSARDCFVPRNDELASVSLAIKFGYLRTLYSDTRHQSLVAEHKTDNRVLEIL